VIEPTSTTPGSQSISIREWEAWQRAQANEAVLRQTMLEEARDALEKLVNSRFDAAQTALNAALAAHQELHAVSAETLLRERTMVRDYLAKLRDADQLAITNAAESVNKRLEAMNELRTQITSERGEFVRNDTYSARHDELISRINTLEQGYVGLRGEVATLLPLPARVNVLENGAANIAGRMTIVAAVITVILTFVVVAVNVLTSSWRVGP
jgi:hypothetical protein